ncbi:hypothetical protein MCOR12_001285 [Pyricularia oryzae]|nr:hypothetical protein MCOR12_001285 [Pyricularia oryzae]
MCESIAEAVTKDADTIRCLDPEQAQRDAQLDDELVDKLKLLYVTDREEPVEDNQDQDHKLPKAESSLWGVRRVVKRRPRRNCTGCGDEFDFINVARCPCSHEYCRGCLNSLFQASTLDESLYPPRCCQQRINLGAQETLSPCLWTPPNSGEAFVGVGPGLPALATHGDAEKAVWKK